MDIIGTLNLVPSSINMNSKLNQRNFQTGYGTFVDELLKYTSLQYNTPYDKKLSKQS